MKTTSFDPTDDLILIQARIWGPLGDDRIRLALDTAASETLVVPEVLDALGYSPREGETIATVTSVIGREEGYRIRVRKFRALGFEFEDFLVNAHNLPEECGLQGLLGLNFLRHFNYEIRSDEGRVQVEPV